MDGSGGMTRKMAAALAAAIDAILQTVGPDDCNLKLYSAGPPRTAIDPVAADFTECLFTGYAEVPLIGVTEQATNSLNHPVLASYGPMVFAAGNPLTVSDTIAGIYVEQDGVGGEIIFFAELDTPINISFPGQTVDMQWVIDCITGIVAVDNIID